MFTLERIERELDAGQIKARAHNGNFWSCRRNGRTQTWKTRPGEFRIPVKIGFRGHGAITQDSRIGRPGDGALPDFIINSMV